MHCNTLRLNLASLACTDMASEHNDQKVKHESHDVVIDMAMSTFQAMPRAVTIGGGVMNWDRVITRTTLGMSF